MEKFGKDENKLKGMDIDHTLPKGEGENEDGNLTLVPNYINGVVMPFDTESVDPKEYFAPSPNHQHNVGSMKAISVGTRRPDFSQFRHDPNNRKAMLVEELERKEINSFIQGGSQPNEIQEAYEVPELRESVKDLASGNRKYKPVENFHKQAQQADIWGIEQSVKMQSMLNNTSTLETEDGQILAVGEKIIQDELQLKEISVNDAEGITPKELLWKGEITLEEFKKITGTADWKYINITGKQKLLSEYVEFADVLKCNDEFIVEPTENRSENGEVYCNIYMLPMPYNALSLKELAKQYIGDNSPSLTEIMNLEGIEPSFSDKVENIKGVNYSNLETKILSELKQEIMPIEYEIVEQYPCFFCNKGDENEPLEFDTEFDTPVHLSCIRKALSSGDFDSEASHMTYLLPEEERKNYDEQIKDWREKESEREY